MPSRTFHYLCLVWKIWDEFTATTGRFNQQSRKRLLTGTVWNVCLFLAVILLPIGGGIAHAQERGVVSFQSVVTGPGFGGLPVVRVFDGLTGQQNASFFAYGPRFRGGVRVAVGDVNRDGVPDIITGAGPGGPPVVRVFDGLTGQELFDFFAFDPSFRGGVFVGAGDINGDGFADIITGAGPGGGPHVKVFDGTNLKLISSFFAYNPNFMGGVFVAAGHRPSPR